MCGVFGGALSRAKAYDSRFTAVSFVLPVLTNCNRCLAATRGSHRNVSSDNIVVHTLFFYHIIHLVIGTIRWCATNCDVANERAVCLYRWVSHF